MNLSYEVTHEEVEGLFSKYGPIQSVEIPLRKFGKGAALGVAYINFEETEGAISAFATLDKTYWQGRKLHILPAQRKPPPTAEQIEKKEKWEKKFDTEKPDKDNSDFKKDKEKTLKVNFDNETNWNYLFMNQDTVATSMAKKLGVEKSELLDKEKGNMAVNMAKSDAIIVNATKEWLKG